MKTKLHFLLLCLSIILLSQCKQEIDFKDPSVPVEERIDAIISQMTLEEKLAILQIESDTTKMHGISVGKLGFMSKDLSPGKAAEQYNEVQKYLRENTRFGIPGMKSGEGIFAYMGYKSSSFTHPIGQAASWDPEVVSKVADILSEEMKSRGIRNVLSPVLNMGRDPRWGRTSETYGEDPYLVTKMGLAYVKTVESKGMVTCLKHFAGNTGHNGQFGAPVFYSERYFREYEFPPYEAAIKEGGAKSIMMAYNTVDAIPCPQHEWLITKIVKGEWAFDGIIYSDGGGLSLVQKSFGIDSSAVNVVAKAMNAGMDVALDNNKYCGESLKKAVEAGLVSEARIDESVRRVLRQIFRTGLYDNPFVDPAYAEKINDCDEHRKASLEISKKCMVLLKNDSSTLPFHKGVKNVLVTGPLGNRLLANHYAGWGRKVVTVVEGVKNLLPEANVVFEPGAGLGYVYYPAIDKKYFYIYEEVKGKIKVKKGLTAEYFTNKEWKGTAKIIKIDENIDFNWGEEAPEGFDKDNFSVRWTGKFKAPFSGTYIFNSVADDGLTVYINNQMVVDMTKGPSNCLFTARGEIYLEKDKEYDIKAEYSENGGASFVTLGWDADEFGMIPAALEAAKKADVIIAVVGMFDDENGDRACLDLDKVQEELILKLAELNKPMVVVIQSGTVITASRWAHKVPSIIVTWYPGEEGGNAISQVLFGDYNPGGKLPITFPKTTGQVPLCYNLLPGRPNDKYLDYGNAPLYCFGHGLSYTKFEYSNLQLSRKSIKRDEVLNVSVDIKNVGTLKGDEVVQLYIHDTYASVSRPLKELKGFKRVSIEPGKTQTLSFKLTKEELSIWDSKMKRVLEPGEFKIMIGASSDDIRVVSSFEVIP